MAASAAATVNIKRVKICPVISFRKIEKATKLIFTANRISSMLINMTMIFFLFKNNPTTPIVKIIAAYVR